MVYTFQFSFANPITKDYDETEFCASNHSEAIALFKDFLKDEGIDFYKIDYDFTLIYSKEDAEIYGDEYATQQDMEDFLLERDE